MKRFINAALGFSLAAIATQTQANLMVCEGPGGDCTAPGGVMENVLFPAVGDTGFDITGYTNQTNTGVTFSAAELMIITGGGQAKLEAVDGLLNEVTIDAENPAIGFEQVAFNVHANLDGFINLAAVDNFGTVFDFGSFAASDTGNNWFGIGSDDVQFIDWWVISGVGITGIDELQQVRVDPSTLPCIENCGGGGGGDPDPVSAPGTVALLSMGLLGLLRLRRHG